MFEYSGSAEVASAGYEGEGGGHRRHGPEAEDGGPRDIHGQGDRGQADR